MYLFMAALGFVAAHVLSLVSRVRTALGRILRLLTSGAPPVAKRGSQGLSGCGLWA